MSESFTAIKDEDWAICWNEESGYVLMMPHMPDEDEELPQEVQVMAALFRRLDDPQFAQEQLDWLRNESLRLGFR